MSKLSFRLALYLGVAMFSIAIARVASAEDECDLSTFDQTEPRQLHGDRNNGGGQFSYASDVDKNAHGQLFARNFVKNDSETGKLSFRWDKPNLIQFPARPLEPGAIACNSYPAHESALQVDYDAPIYFGANELEQPAAIYMRYAGPVADNGSSSSILKSSFIDKEGKLQPFEVKVDYKVSDGTVKTINIRTSDNVIATFSAGKRFWSRETTEGFLEYAKKDGIDSGISDAMKFASVEPGYAQYLWASGAEPFLYLRGGVFGFGAGSKSYGKQDVRVAVFDLEQEPIAVGLVTLPFTNNE
ncbi:hypothetical protein [Rhizobium leguminosarum]|uniref:hypothetical protein n=1 Tax=Rhizobium leguminosarum TaxID=384 RepID=UPI00144127D5|nr:hypothetical protein [Rhizobium leguminosarum]MBY5794888.1 hypothetical protein [Rhizobium leguminosarum]NKK32507.1 hypothetical protein [Rhizobium leguminosarum bv. viciae]